MQFLKVHPESVSELRSVFAKKMIMTLLIVQTKIGTEMCFDKPFASYQVSV